MPDAPDQAGFNDLLRGFDIDYPNPPQLTPALLIFLKSLNVSLQTAGVAQERAFDRINQATWDADGDINRTAGRTTKNITADLLRRGVLSSGEANTRYNNQAEDIAVSKRDLQRSKTTSLSDAGMAYRQTKDTARMQALDRVIATEQDQATAAATSQQRTDDIARQSALLDKQASDEAAARQHYVDTIKQIFGSDPATAAAMAGFAP